MNIFLLSIIIFAGAFGTYENCRRYSLSPVLVSSVMGLMASFIFFVQNFRDPFLINAFFGATFIGMASAKNFSRLQIGFSSFIFIVLYIKLIPFLNGMGGALGFSAFLSIGCSFLLKKLIISFNLIPKHK